MSNIKQWLMAVRQTPTLRAVKSECVANSWVKPEYNVSRFGFEVTMYIYQQTTVSGATTQPQVRSTWRRRVVQSVGIVGLGLCALVATPTFADDERCNSDGSGGSWLLHGFNRTNCADSSAVSVVNKYNVSKLELKWVLDAGVVPLGSAKNPINNPRAENGPSTGVAVDSNGIVYVPVFDGRILKIDSTRTDGTNLDGTAKPKLLSTFDLFSDPKYSGASSTNGDDVFATRMHPSIIGGAIYAGNYNFFGAFASQAGIFADKGTGTTSPTNLNYKSQGAVLYKIDKATGNLIWKTSIDSNPQTMISAIGASPVNRLLLNDLIIVAFGTELSGTLGFYPFSADPNNDPFGGHCCDMRGGVAAVRASDGKVIWKTYTVPKQTIPSLAQIVQQGTVDAWNGVSVWGGGNFPVSYKNRLVYVGTGELYNAPIAADQCQQNLLASGAVDSSITDCLRVQQDGSISTADFADTQFESLVPLVRSPKLPLPDSVIALNFDTGKIAWTAQVNGYDVWNASGFAPFNPSFVNFIPFTPPYLRGANIFQQFTIKDLDIAEQPILVEGITMANGVKRDVILVTSKATTVNAFDAASGEHLWGPVRFGVGGLTGDGIIWGSASDGKRLYSNTGISSDVTLADMNDPANPKQIVKSSCIPQGFKDRGNPATGNPAQVVWTGGMYTAIDIASGTIAWQRCVVGQGIDANRLPNGQLGAGRSQAPLSVANGVVVAPGASSYVPFGVSDPNVFAEVLLLDADTGALLRSLPLSAPNKPSGNTLSYQRPVIVGDRVYITNGEHRYDGLPSPRDNYNRILMYQLKK